MQQPVIDIKDTKLFFSPNALLSAVGNSLVSPLFNNVFLVKGIFKNGKGVNYNGNYYDVLKDEYSEASITLVVPGILRHQLKDGQLIEALAFLNKRHQPAGARIELLLNVTELISKKEKIIDEQEKKALELIQRKAKSGYKDLRGFIKNKLYAQEPVNITILIGLSAIIDADIKHQLKDASPVYNIKYVRINLSQVKEIIYYVGEHADEDILIISRGGGENIQLFNNTELAENVLTLKSIFVTAIGHSDDEPLLQKVADKAFITPTSLGQFLYDVYISTLEEFNNSKARLIDDLTRQIQLNFQHQIIDLNSQLGNTSRAYQDLAKNAELEQQQLLNAFLKQRRKSNVLVILLILTMAFLLGYFLFARK